MISVDLYLGSFLIVAGFLLSLLNLKRLVSGSTNFSAVLISENILLTCVGVAFISRSLHMGPFNANLEDIGERMATMDLNQDMDCSFLNVLKSYGPFVISVVNSFLSLIIDNYMHYKMVNDIRKEDEENTVRNLEIFRNQNVKSIFEFGKKYFSYLAIGLQWIVPILIALSMYPMEIKEKFLSNEVRSHPDICVAMIDFTNETCVPFNKGNLSMELRNFIPSYLEVYENNINGSVELDSIIKNVNSIVANFKNMSHSESVSREPKSDNNCMKICYLDNSNVLLYMFGLSVFSYFVPITISTVILTKIHMIEVKRPHVKTFVSRELLYNILFWTPAMFDTFLSLMFCSYSTNGMKTSIFNVIANVYQAAKNFMNTKYFKDNTVSPI